MPNSPVSPDSDQKKNARIEYLENLTKRQMFNLELLASLGELHHSASLDRKPEKILEIAQEHLLKIIQFDAIAFYLVEETDAEFSLKYVYPREAGRKLSKLVDSSIMDSTFAWAVNQNRPVMVKSSGKHQSLILHVLSTKRRVRGMFAGVLKEPRSRLEDTAQYTLSIILQHTANALESLMLYNLLQETNSHLENKVLERTSDLEQHMVKLEEEIAYRKLAEESLWVARQDVESTLKAKTDLLDQFSYELKAPINSILGYGEIIRSEIEKNGESALHENFENMQSTGRHLLKLIDDIQKLIHFNKPQLRLQVQEFSVSEMLSGVLDTLFPISKKYNNHVRLKIHSSVATMVSDEARLRQILLNIIENSCKYTRNGEISVGCFEVFHGNQEWIQFNIKDDGKGMKEEEIAKWLASDGVRTSDFNEAKAYGMGLIFSKRLCAMLGGNIKIESQLGKGTTCKIKLPRHYDAPEFEEENIDSGRIQTMRPAQQNETPASPATRSAFSKENQKNINREMVGKGIWVFDEDISSKKILCGILDNEGFLSKAIEDPEHFGEIKNQQVDLILVCLGRNREKGLRFVDAMREQESLSYIPILVFSAQEVSETDRLRLQDKVQDILIKSNCTRVELISRIKNLIGHQPVE